MTTLRKVLDLLTARERRQAYLLLPLVIVMALAEVAGIASIAPFLSAIADPAGARSSPILGWFYDTGGFQSDRTFLVAVGGVVLIALVGSNIVLAAGNYALFKFGAMRNHSISRRLLIRYLQQPYTFFLERNSSSLANNILQEVNQVINGIVLPGLQAVAKAFGVVAIMVLLVVLNPLMAALIALLMGGGYGIIYLLIRKRLTRMGTQRVRVNQGRFKAASEAMGGIKDLKLMGREAEAVEQFTAPSRMFAIFEANQQIMLRLPRFMLEALAFGGMIVIVLGMMIAGASVAELLPLLGVYAFAGYRMMPALNDVFNGMSRIRYSSGALDEVHEMVRRVDARKADPETFQDRTHIEPLPFVDGLHLEGVHYRYPGSREHVLKGIDLDVPPLASVAFVGPTGSGKTTIVDLILGLLEPTEGRITVDGVVLSEEVMPRWQRCIGYVPQSIFLTDDTIARNIAFGMPADRIDMDAVKKAAKIAQIDEFIEGTLVDGYETIVGERGVRLSGGQRQRLGIARALYHDPDVLVLDEATSALDGRTEQQLFEALGALAGRKTLITIAHRLATVRDCDTIFVMEGGHLVGRGSYEHLLQHSSHFQGLAATGMDGTATDVRSVPQRS